MTDKSPEAEYERNARACDYAHELVEALRHGIAVVRGATNEFGEQPAWTNFLSEGRALLALIDGDDT